MNNKPLIIFDCDGTILDTYDLIIESVYRTFKDVFPNYNLTPQEANSFFGPHLKDSFAKYVENEKDIDYCIARYRYHNDLLMPQYISVYPGIKQLLMDLKKLNYIIVILSNKVTSAIKYGLELTMLTNYFDDIYGVDQMLKPKPDPNGIITLKQKFNRKKALFIGDTIIDIQTGLNANIPTIGVTWCQVDYQTFKDSNATFIVDKADQILKIVQEMDMS